jgi:predicted Mrr-cat superfamily restriction endonuclease
MEEEEKKYLDSKAEEIRKLGDRNIIEIGKILIEVRSKLSYHRTGTYCKWLNEKLKMSREAARMLENRARIFLKTNSAEGVKKISNEVVRYLVRNADKLSKEETLEIMENKGLALEKIKEEKFEMANKKKFGKLNLKCEEITKILRSIERKGTADQIRSLGALEMVAKRLREEAKELREKMQRQQEERMNQKIF